MCGGRRGQEGRGIRGRRVRAQDVAAAKTSSDAPSTRVLDRYTSRDRAVHLLSALCASMFTAGGSEGSTLKQALGGQRNGGIVHSRAIVHTDSFFLSRSHRSLLPSSTAPRIERRQARSPAALLLALLNALVVRIVDPAPKVLDVPEPVRDVVTDVLHTMDDVTGLPAARDVSASP